MLKNIHLWLPNYILHGIRFKEKPPSLTQVVFCISDHFEPYWNKVGCDVASLRVETWAKQYPDISQRHVDSDGRHPKYTFFYPAEEYDPKLLDMIAELCYKGWGEVEIHLHHNNDTAEGLREKLLHFREVLWEKHGLLSKDVKTGGVKYGFIHGDWALDNSRKDGSCCGVNNELTILKETGCYADFTLPSAPSDTQTEKINSIYYAIDDPHCPKSHNMGEDLVAGKDEGEGLLMIQGPLALNWRRRRGWLLPRIDNGSITHINPVLSDRVSLWIKHAPRIVGRPDWVFVKVYTHGCQEMIMNYLFSEGLDALFSILERDYSDNKSFRLHYVTAREMYNIIKTLEYGNEVSLQAIESSFLVRKS